MGLRLHVSEVMNPLPLWTPLPLGGVHSAGLLTPA